MTLGYKLSRLRKENNYTQEQLADILGVSRQAISKWESDITYPETDKLVKISNLFDCSLDYLLRDTADVKVGSRSSDTADAKVSSRSSDNTGRGASQEKKKGRLFDSELFAFIKSFRDKKSKHTIFGTPLWHIGKHARGLIAIGFDAKGIIAIGFKARGILSIGTISLGLLSIGFLSLGLVSLGMLAIGLLCAGCFSVGVFTAGAISVGIISLGAVAIGDFSIGALAVGRYFALGDTAMAKIAIGDTKAIGSVFEYVGELSAEVLASVRAALDDTVPFYLSWAKKIIMLFL